MILVLAGAGVRLAGEGFFGGGDAVGGLILVFGGGSGVEGAGGLGGLVLGGGGLLEGLGGLRGLGGEFGSGALGLLLEILGVFGGLVDAVGKGALLIGGGAGVGFGGGGGFVSLGEGGGLIGKVLLLGGELAGLFGGLLVGGGGLWGVGGEGALFGLGGLLELVGGVGELLLGLVGLSVLGEGFGGVGLPGGVLGGGFGGTVVGKMLLLLLGGLFDLVGEFQGVLIGGVAGARRLAGGLGPADFIGEVLGFLLQVGGGLVVLVGLIEGGLTRAGGGIGLRRGGLKFLGGLVQGGFGGALVAGGVGEFIVLEFLDDGIEFGGVGAFGAGLAEGVAMLLVEGADVAVEFLLGLGEGGGLVGGVGILHGVELIAEGLLGLLDLLEFADEVIHAGLVGVGGGFLQLGIVLDELVEAGLKLFLLFEEPGVVGILGEGVGELFLLPGEVLQGLGEGLILGGVLQGVGHLLQAVEGLAGVGGGAGFAGLAGGLLIGGEAGLDGVLLGLLDGLVGDRAELLGKGGEAGVVGLVGGLAQKIAGVGKLLLEVGDFLAVLVGEGGILVGLLERVEFGLGVLQPGGGLGDGVGEIFGGLGVLALGQGRGGLIEGEGLFLGVGGLRIGVAVVGGAELTGDLPGGGRGGDGFEDGGQVEGPGAVEVGGGGGEGHVEGLGVTLVDLNESLDFGHAEVVVGGELEGDGVIGADNEGAGLGVRLGDDDGGGESGIARMVRAWLSGLSRPSALTSLMWYWVERSMVRSAE